MHQYLFHFGDYLKATVHLTDAEDLAYRRLLDMYYDTEKPIPLETQSVSRRLRVAKPVVESVLKEFFVEGQHGWHNKRCDEEIAEYGRICERNRANGKLGGRRKQTQSVPSGNPVATQTEPRAKQTQNPKPKTIVNPLPLSGFDEFWLAYPKKVARGSAEKSWRKESPPLADVLAAVAIQSQSEQWRKDGGQYIPNPGTWLNQRRWLDDIASEQEAASWMPTLPC